MKKSSLVLTLASVVFAIPVSAQYASPLLLERVETRTLDCLDSSDSRTCEKAAGSAKTLASSNVNEECKREMDLLETYLSTSAFFAKYSLQDKFNESVSSIIKDLEDMRKVCQEPSTK